MLNKNYLYTGLSMCAAVVISALVFVLLEPSMLRAQTANEEFIVTQSITGEISFRVAVPDVSMIGAIGGVSGGYSTGTTQAVVETNDPDGYTLSIRFPFATSSGMQANTESTFINNYTPTDPNTPDFIWQDNAAGGASEFGYTVSASTTDDLAQDFKDNGSVCGGAGTFDGDFTCWYNASTTDKTIVNRTTGSTPAGGATTTVTFKVAVPSSPSPVLDIDTYTATATLTATVN